MLERLPDTRHSSDIHTTSILIDIHEQPFIMSDPNVYIVGLHAWASYHAIPSAKHYGIDAWVQETAYLYKDRFNLLSDPIAIGNAIYIFFQMETLFAAYNDWLITDLDYALHNSDTFIITIKGIPGASNHGRQHCLIDGRTGEVVSGDRSQMHHRQLQLGTSHR